MAAQSEQIKNNFLNNPYAQQVLNVANGQVSALDAEVCLFFFRQPTAFQDVPSRVNCIVC